MLATEPIKLKEVMEELRMRIEVCRVLGWRFSRVGNVRVGRAC